MSENNNNEPKKETAEISEELLKKEEKDVENNKTDLNQNPNNEDSKTIQKSDQVEKKKRLSKKALIILTIILAILIVLIVVIGMNVHKKKVIEDYENNLTEVDKTMLNGSMYAEQTSGMILKVWQNAIFDQWNDETSQYTGGASDFNEAIANYTSSKDYNTKIKEVKQSVDKTNSLMKNLKNPPDGYVDAYADLKKYYSDFLSFTTLAISPSGNYAEYSEKYNDLDTKILADHNSIQIYVNN